MEWTESIWPTASGFILMTNCHQIPPHLQAPMSASKLSLISLLNTLTKLSAFHTSSTTGILPTFPPQGAFPLPQSSYPRPSPYPSKTIRRQPKPIPLHHKFVIPKPSIIPLLRLQLSATEPSRIRGSQNIEWRGIALPVVAAYCQMTIYS